MASTTARKFATRISIPESARDELIDLLNARLAEALDLYGQLKQAHWNVKGSDFIQLHELYDAIAAEVIDHVDLIAERATTLGGRALGTVRMAASASSLDEYPLDAVDGPATLEVIADRLAAFGALLRSDIDTSTTLGDQDTADLFTEVSRAIDKNLWFVEAHLQT
jgi:starvation-inducible DNA-binding protein